MTRPPPVTHTQCLAGNLSQLLTLVYVTSCRTAGNLRGPGRNAIARTSGLLLSHMFVTQIIARNQKLPCECIDRYDQDRTQQHSSRAVDDG